MTKQYVRYVLCDRNHPDNQNLTIHDGGPLYCYGILHRTLKAAHRCKKAYLKGNPDIAKVTRHKENRTVTDGAKGASRSR